MKIGIVVHPLKDAALRAADKLREIAVQEGVEVVEASNEVACEAVVALGGDGTILRAAGIAFGHGVPVAGVNLGSLGFLSAVNVDQIQELVRSLVAGNYDVEERLMLDAAASGGGKEVARVAALNEIVLERQTLSKVISIKVSIDNETVATYIADGFIVSTPTGSTAYSLSAGGPVVEPQVRSMVLTPVSAHTPLWRSIVTAPGRTVTLTTPDPVGFSADGAEVCTLQGGGTVSVRAHETPLKLIALGGPKFYDKLRSRFRIDS